MCYYQCMPRGVLSGTEPQGLGSRLGQMTPWESRLGGSPSRECLWIVSPFHMDNRSENPARYFSNPFLLHSSIHSLSRDSTAFFCNSSVIQLTIHSDIHVPCDENSVYVYDGLPDFVSSTPSHQSHVLGVFCSEDTTYPATVEATSGVCCFQTLFFLWF